MGFRRDVSLRARTDPGILLGSHHIGFRERSCREKIAGEEVDAKGPPTCAAKQTLLSKRGWRRRRSGRTTEDDQDDRRTVDRSNSDLPSPSLSSVEQAKRKKQRTWAGTDQHESRSDFEIARSATRSTISRTKRWWRGERGAADLLTESCKKPSGLTEFC